MSTLKSITSKARPPGRTLVLEPWVFADEWPKKPKEAVCVGLRMMSEADKSKARAEADRVAWELHPNGGPNWIDAFNDCLMRQVAALGICDPNNVTKATEVLPFAEDEVRTALTSKGAEFIFFSIDVFEVESSAIEPEIDEEEIDEFVDLLTSSADRLTPQHRKLLHHVFEAIR